MKIKSLLLILFTYCMSLMQAQAQDGMVLTGDTRLACEAILCLSAASTRPSECAPSLARYFGIHKKTMSKTISARRDFLNMCPSVGGDPQMLSLTNTLANSSGRCDAASLNNDLYSGLKRYYHLPELKVIKNKFPSYCAALYAHTYTEYHQTGKKPIYVGDPDWGGYWVEADQYDEAKVKYDIWLAEFQEEVRKAKAEADRGN